jgi:hypothetical protein
LATPILTLPNAYDSFSSGRNNSAWLLSSEVEPTVAVKRFGLGKERHGYGTPNEFSDYSPDLSRKPISNNPFPPFLDMKRLQKKIRADDTFRELGPFPLFLFLPFCFACFLAHRHTLDHDDTPTLDANCPSEGEEPLPIGGGCFLLHDGAGCFTLIFWGCVI